MPALFDRFLALQEKEYPADELAIVRAHLKKWEAIKRFPTEPLKTLPEDVLVFGGQGAGKSTFVDNWSGSPLIPAVGSLNTDAINETIDENFPKGDHDHLRAGAFASGEPARILNKFVDWAGLPQVIDVAALTAGLKPKDQTGRIIAPSAKLHFNTQAEFYPLSHVHIVFCNPKIAFERAQKRNAERDIVAPKDYQQKIDHIQNGHNQNFYFWPLAAQLHKTVLLWDNSGDHMVLMGAISNRYAPKATADKPVIFHRINEQSLLAHGLDERTVSAMWHLSRIFEREYEDSWDMIATARTYWVTDKPLPGDAVLAAPSLQTAAETAMKTLESRNMTDDMRAAKISGLKKYFDAKPPRARGLVIETNTPKILKAFRIIDTQRSWRMHRLSNS